MTDDPDEIERLSQALALVEGFQLLVLECVGVESWALHSVLGVIQERVAELRGVPPLILVYDPTLTTDSEGNLRDEAWVEGVLEPILELSAVAFLDRETPSLPFGEPPAAPSPATPGASVVAVIDGTSAATSDGSELPSWVHLFHRLNERRNALTRAFAGTLALALPPRLVRLLLEEAPDLASVRSGTFDVASAPDHGGSRVHSLLPWYPAHLVREAAMRRLAADPRLSVAARHDLLGDLHRSAETRYWMRNSIGADLALIELLLGLFSAEELRRFVATYFGAALAERHASAASSAEDLAESVISAVPADRSFFEILVRERPGRYADIARVASQLGFELLPLKPRHASLSPGELHEALLRLSREQLEQTVLLAGLMGKPQPTRGDLRDARALARMSVRALLAQAEKEGPMGLQRLSEALEIVASREPGGSSG